MVVARWYPVESALSVYPSGHKIRLDFRAQFQASRQVNIVVVGEADGRAGNESHFEILHSVSWL
jgi:hypothetical protein